MTDNEERRPHGENADGAKKNQQDTSSVTPHPWVAVTPAQLYNEYEGLPKFQKVALQVRPNAPLDVQLDCVTSSRPDLQIWIQCFDLNTALAWQRAVSSGVGSVLWPGVNVRAAR